MIRPAFALLAARAVGGRAGDAVLAAVAVQLVHEFSLLHDDIIDADRRRRHRPSAWVMFGSPAALLAGDALWALALQVITESTSCSEDGRGMRMLVTALRRLVDGQNADTDFLRRDRVLLSQCRQMAADKTGSLFGLACGLGALFGGGTPTQIGHLQRSGEHLGMAFQLVDDLLGIWGDPTVTGKPVGTDVAARKRTLPVVAALNSGTTAGAELASLYRCDRPWNPDETARVVELIDHAGGRTWARQQTEHHITQAEHALRQATPALDAATALTTLARTLTHHTP